MYKIVLLGAGNVAWHLAQHLEQVGHRIIKVYSRHLVNAKVLCQQLYEAEPTQNLDFSDRSQADLFLLCVSDNAMPEVLAALKLPANATLAHTSGTQPLQLLSGKAENIAVFYPLQTFTKSKNVNFRTVPLCIEASNQHTLDFIGDIATNLSKEVYVLDTAQRQVLHLAAVIACNFSNHLFAIAQEILKDKDIDFEMLFPLINETVQKAMQLPPKEAQTGPAKRGDTQTMNKHLTLLENYPRYKKIYEMISDSISKV